MEDKNCRKRKIDAQKSSKSPELRSNNRPNLPEIGQLPPGHSLEWSKSHKHWYVRDHNTRKSIWLEDWKAKNRKSEGRLQKKQKKEAHSKVNVAHSSSSTTGECISNDDFAMEIRHEDPDSRDPRRGRKRKKIETKNEGFHTSAKTKHEQSGVSFNFTADDFMTACTKSVENNTPCRELKQRESDSGPLILNESMEQMDFESQTPAVSSVVVEEAMEIDYVAEVQDLRSTRADSWPKKISYLSDLGSSEQQVEHGRSNDSGSGYHRCFVILDTNVLLDELNLLREMERFSYLKSENDTVVIAMIPWVVLQELDVLKDRFRNKKDMTDRVENAIKHIYTEVCRESPNFLTQSFQNDSIRVQNLLAERNDDRILKCALILEDEIDQKLDSVIICTKDRNLIVKAKSGKLKTATPAELRKHLGTVDQMQNSNRARNRGGVAAPSARGLSSKVDSMKNRRFDDSARDKIGFEDARFSPDIQESSHNRGIRTQKRGTGVRSEKSHSTNSPKSVNRHTSPSPSQPVSAGANLDSDIVNSQLSVIQEVLSWLLKREMRKAFKDTWTEIIVEKPPFTLIKILNCFKKHWVAVFRFVWPTGPTQEMFVRARNLMESMEKLGDIQKDSMKIELIRILTKILEPLRGRDKIKQCLIKLEETGFD